MRACGAISLLRDSAGEVAEEHVADADARNEQTRKQAAVAPMRPLQSV